MEIWKSVDWSQAPAWARFFAVNRSGNGYWFENKPVKGHVWSVPDKNTRSERGPEYDAAIAARYWEASLQERPGMHFTSEPFKVKPDWAKAPTWARFFAINASGSSHWYRNKPIQGKRVWFTVFQEDVAEGPPYHIVYAQGIWDQSLQERPQAAKAPAPTKDYAPDWKQAPDWARYCTVDANGRVHWFEHQPWAMGNDAGEKYWSAKTGRWEYYEDVEAPGATGSDWTRMSYRRPSPRMAKRDDRKDVVKAIAQEGIDQLHKIKTAIEGLQTEIEGRDEEIRELRHDLAFALAEIANTQHMERIGNIAATVPDLENRLATTRGVVDSLNSTILTLQQDLLAANCLATNATASTARHRKEVETQKGINTLLFAAMDILASQKNRAETENKALREQLAILAPKPVA